MKNWAGNLTYRARRLLEAESVEELQAMVAASPRLRPIGSRHSFSDIGDTDGDLVSLRRLPRRFEVDRAASTVTIDGGSTYGDVCEALDAAGLGLDNLPSLPHVTAAGACATGTHGSGDRSGVLATAVAALELVLADGSRTNVDAEGDLPLAAAAVSLGALGVVTSLTLRAEPRYDVRQDVYERLPAAAFADALEAATSLAQSVSCFTTWREPEIDQIWLKRRVADDGSAAGVPADLFGATPASRDLHPIRELPADACTPQLGRPGPWFERLPHFRLSHTPSSGEELQSELFVRREDAAAAFHALHAIRNELAPVVQVSELRTIAGDELWLSPAYRRASAAFHFTWIADTERVLRVLPLVERALEPFEPRAHWAKLSTLPPAAIARATPRLREFAALAASVDPGGKLRNERLEALFDAA